MVKGVLRIARYFAIIGCCALGFATIVASGGGGGGGEAAPTVFISQILSDPDTDGDIKFTAFSTFEISSARETGSVLAGIHPISGDEYRGFLSFPLGGPGGVPGTAGILSATLEISVISMTVATPNQTVPLLIDLVSFPPPTIIASDFDRNLQPPLQSMIFNVFTSDTGTTLLVDVTVLMDEAQRQGLADFQLRLLLDFSALSGLVEIDDSISETAPLLTVEFF